ncbi:MAG: hypothetical protein JWN02_2194 [Acidobacteria bacterium]|nr:hypothetical protein [Acidobacteriota bacterium]
MLVVPIHATLAPLIPMVESQVPKIVSKTDAYELDPQQRFGLKYQLLRDPIALNMQGAGLHVTAGMHYALEGCSRTKNPVNGTYKMWPCLSCGFGEPLRDAEISLHSHFDWDPQWRLRSATTARPVDFGGNRCKVSFVGLDITDWKLGPLVNEQLAEVARTIDRNVPKLTSIKPNAQQVWAALQAPVEIAPKTWLLFEPQEVGLSPIRGNGLEVTSALALRARTRVVIGERPLVIATALPPLKLVVGEPGNTVRVPMDLDLPYAEAGRILTEQFGKRSYDQTGQKLAVDTIRLSPAGNGRVTIEAQIDYDAGRLKRYHGLVYLDGAPTFDPATGSVVIADLEYSIDPHKNAFIRIADRVVHDAVRSRLREGAHWPVTEQLAATRAEIERGLTRPLSAGVSIRVHVDSIQPTAVIPLADTLAIRIVATGSAQIDVRDWR